MKRGAPETPLFHLTKNYESKIVKTILESQNPRLDF